MLAVGILFLAVAVVSTDQASWARIVEIVASLIMIFVAIRELRGGPPA